VITAGLDIGQKRDPTAFSLTQAELRTVHGKPATYHLVRYLRRLPLGTPYPEVAATITRLLRTAEARTGLPIPLYADATGVGQPVIDILLDAGLDTIIPVYFTYGDKRTEHEDGTVTLGKAWMVSRLQALLQSMRLRIPEIPEANALVKELLAYEIRIAQDANTQYGAFTTGAHDDLVTALGLSVQLDPVLAASTAGVFGTDAPALDPLRGESYEAGLLAAALVESGPLGPYPGGVY
jgi:hypothetical protein